MRLPRFLVPRAIGIAAVLLVASSALPHVAFAETLTAQEALRRAAKQNPGLRAALIDISAAQLSVEAEASARDPVFIASATGSHTEAVSQSTVAGADDITSTQTIEAKAAFQFQTDVGTSLEVGTSGDVTWRNRQTAALGTQPAYTALAYLTARQPLLKGAGTDAVLAQERQAAAALTVTELQRDAAASQTALEVLSAYWELWYATRAVEVQEKALSVAEKQLKDANTKLNDLGAGSKVDVLQFESNVASTKDGLSQARANRVARSLALSQLLGVKTPNAQPMDASGDLPTFGPQSDVTTLVAQASQRSPDLAAARADLEAAAIRIEAADDADQPDLDVFATVSAGLLFGDDGSGVSLLGGRPAFSVTGGIELMLPIGGGRAEADAARTRMQKKASEVRYEEREIALASEIASLDNSIRAGAEQVSLASDTARVAGELAEAERQRLLLGTNTPYDVVRAEQTLREAELRKLRAQVDEVTNHYRLEHATGVLLERFGGLFARSPS